MASDPLATALLESDRLYFELGAEVESVDGAALAWMPGMQHAAAACVVQRVNDGYGPIAAKPHEWVTEMTRRLTAMGCSVARVYVDRSVPDLERALEQAGFARRVEIGYIWPGPERPGQSGKRGPERPGQSGRLGPPHSGRPDVSLRPVRTEADWDAKVELHAGEHRAADGHVMSGSSWVQLERAKCDSGGMQPYLIEVDGEVCGAIAAIRVDGLLRAKNVFVRADRRRQGIGAATMAGMAALAQAEGDRTVGIFGVAGKPGNALYRHLGMTPTAERTEWSRRL